MTTAEHELPSSSERNTDEKSCTLPSLSVDISARFSDAESTFDVDAAFDVLPGETVVVLGPSGSGKTLVLETIGGFHQHTGEITLDGEDITNHPPEDREFGFVFQDYALFPHMTVRRNVAFGQQFHDEPTTEELPDPDALLARLGVGSLAERSPRTLSGGEQQRVALARSLAIQPDVLLLDEPLAALDVPTQQALRNDLAEVLTDVTAVYVTHNRTTARALADRIVVMHDGEIVQQGSPEEVFEHPESPMVARFTGSNAIDLSATPSLREILDSDESADGHMAIRPEAVAISEAEGDIEATVERTVREDTTTRVTLSFDDVTIDAFTEDPPKVGDDVWVTFPRAKRSYC